MGIYALNYGWINNKILLIWVEYGVFSQITHKLSIKVLGFSISNLSFHLTIPTNFGDSFETNHRFSDKFLMERYVGKIVLLA